MPALRTRSAESTAGITSVCPRRGGIVTSPTYRSGERSTERSVLLFKILKTCRWWDGALRSSLPNSKAVLLRFLHAASKWGSESPRPGAQAA